MLILSENLLSLPLHDHSFWSVVPFDRGTDFSQSLTPQFPELPSPSLLHQLLEIGPDQVLGLLRWDDKNNNHTREKYNPKCLSRI